MKFLNSWGGNKLAEVDQTVKDSLEAYMAAPYRMEIYWDEDYWAATFPELPGLVAAGDDWNELAEAIEDAKRAYFDSALATGRTIPAPRTHREERSGKIVVRLPKSLHREAAFAAQHNAVSLNSFITSAVAKEVGRLETRHASSVYVRVEDSVSTVTTQAQAKPVVGRSPMTRFLAWGATSLQAAQNSIVLRDTVNV